MLATCRRPIYVLMMSTQYDQRSLIEALDSGADDFIGKRPFRRGALCQTARRRAYPLHATRIAPHRHHRPVDRVVQPPGFLRAGNRSLRPRHPAGWQPVGHHPRHRHFKRINDCYGHETGDEAIRVCADTARLTKAVTGRLGGDEFALLLEDLPLPEAIEIAEDLRTRLAARPFNTGKDCITLTWSIGVGEGRPGDSVDQILARADAALYDAKLGGRNRVVSAGAELLTRPAIVSDGLARASVF